MTQDADQQIPSHQNTPDELLTLNLEALSQVDAELANAVLALASSCLMSTNEQVPVVISIRDDSGEISVSEEKIRTNLSQLPATETREPIYLLIGIGAGHELYEIYTGSHCPFPELPNRKIPIYVVEPDLRYLLLVMHLHDLRDLFLSQRVLFFTGKDAAKQYGQYLRGHRQALLPQMRISLWYSSDHEIVKDCTQLTQAIADEIGREVREREQSINSHYQDHTSFTWREILTSKERPLRILGITSRFTSYLQYCTRDLMSGFKDLGHKTCISIEKTDISRTTMRDLLALLDNFKPDIIIVINHFRDEYPFIPANIPFANWIQDLLPDLRRPSTRSLSLMDYSFVFLPRWRDILQQEPAYSNHEFHHLPLGIDAETYHYLPDSSKVCDVVYISHVPNPSDTLEAFRDHNIEFVINPEEADLLDSKNLTYDELLLSYMLILNIWDNLLIDDLWLYDFPEKKEPFIERILKQAGISVNDAIKTYYLRASRLTNELRASIKTRPISALLNNGIDVHLYGNNWDKYPKLKTAWRGVAENGPPLNQIMNRARICLNNSPGVSLHMRALETLGAGAFMLNRRIPKDEANIADYMTEDEDVFFFSNEYDISDRVRLFLKDEKTRNQAAERANKKALSLFRYQHIAAKMLTTIEERLKQVH